MHALHARLHPPKRTPWGRLPRRRFQDVTCELWMRRLGRVGWRGTVMPQFLVRNWRRRVVQKVFPASLHYGFPPPGAWPLPPHCAGSGRPSCIRSADDSDSEFVPVRPIEYRRCGPDHTNSARPRPLPRRPLAPPRPFPRARGTWLVGGSLCGAAAASAPLPPPTVVGVAGVFKYSVAIAQCRTMTACKLASACCFAAYIS